MCVCVCFSGIFSSFFLHVFHSRLAILRLHQQSHAHTFLMYAQSLLCVMCVCVRLEDPKGNEKNTWAHLKFFFLKTENLIRLYNNWPSLFSEVRDPTENSSIFSLRHRSNDRLLFKIHPVTVLITPV